MLRMLVNICPDSTCVIDTWWSYTTSLIRYVCMCVCEWQNGANDEVNPTLSASLWAAAENLSFH